MSYVIYSIKDVVVGTFFEPKIYANDEVAKREFSSVCEQARFAEDLQFYKLGEFNIDTGVITSNVEFVTSGKKVGE